MTGDLETAIRKNAGGPAKSSGRSGSMEQHKLPDSTSSTRVREMRRLCGEKSAEIADIV